jgi:hypothetical protein
MVCKIDGANLRAFSSLQSNRKDTALISASFDEVLSVASKWRDEQAPIRLVAYLKRVAFASNCTVISVSDKEIGVQFSEQLKGVCAVRLEGCDFSFGAPDNMAPSETALTGLQLDVGFSLISEDGEWVWLVEIK